MNDQSIIRLGGIIFILFLHNTETPFNQITSLAMRTNPMLACLLLSPYKQITKQSDESSRNQRCGTGRCSIAIFIVATVDRNNPSVIAAEVEKGNIGTY